MKSKTKIGKQSERKTNPLLVETIRAAKKHDAWLNVAGILTSPRRKAMNMNLMEIDEQAKDGESIVVPGKVLSQGEVTKKIRLIAFGFSETTREKLLKSKIDAVRIIDEIKKNPEAKNLRVLGK